MNSRLLLAAVSACTLAACAQPLPQRNAAAPATLPAVGGPTIVFQCGDTAVPTQFGTNAMTLTLDGRSLTLPQAISANGARYAGLGPDGPVEFWNTGNRAMLTVGPRAYPECREVPGARS